MSVWRTAALAVTVDFDDFQRAHEEALSRGEDCDRITVGAEVDIDDALEEATVDQLREALGREVPGYTLEQLDAIRECFAAASHGDTATALALLPRIFEHQAQLSAAEAGLRACHRRAA